MKQDNVLHVKTNMSRMTALCPVMTGIKTRETMGGEI